MKLWLFSFWAAVHLAVLAVHGSPVVLPLFAKPVDRAMLPHHHGAHSKTLDVSLTTWMNHSADLQWYTNITVGTPPQKFTVLIDTGSPWVLIPRSNCTTCGSHARFNPAKSSTFQNKPGIQDQFLFGTGGDTVPFSVPQGANCTMVTDTAGLQGLSAPGQSIVVCDVYGDALRSQPMDGIWGFPPLALDTQNQSFYGNLYRSGQLPSPEFGLYYVPRAQNGAELTLGGTDKSKYQGDITNLPLNTNLSSGVNQWVMDISALYINGKQLPASASGNGPRAAAIMDSGTSFMMVPNANLTRSIYAQISDKIQPLDNAGTWGAACKTVDTIARDVTFTLGREKSLNVTLPKEVFNLGPYDGKPGMCQTVFVSALGSNVAPDGSLGWVFGSPLFKYYYTIWNGADMTLGFAQPKKVKDKDKC